MFGLMRAFLVVLALFSFSQAVQAQDEQQSLQIEVIDGEAGVNIIDSSATNYSPSMPDNNSVGMYIMMQDCIHYYEFYYGHDWANYICLMGLSDAY